MRRSTFIRRASAILAVGLFSASSVLHASGGDEFMENIFTPQYHVPVPELQDYAAGKLGIVAPTYWRVYHFLAYRALTGHALSKTELATLDVQGHRVGEKTGGLHDAYSDERNGVDTWRKARAAVRGAPAVSVAVDIDVGDFSMIINCPVDAFHRASATLAQRIEQGGQQWAAVWLTNQDAVFANCSPAIDRSARSDTPAPRPLTLPPPLPAKAPAWLQKDHAYQRAAAHFYAGRFDEARAQFLAIAGDAASPWQPLGKYLAARALIRSAVAVPGIPESDDQKRVVGERLGKARTEMAALAPTQAPARRLMDWIDIRVRPEERRRELSAALSVDTISPATVQMVTDYLFLMDKLSPEDMIRAPDPMTAWIGVMQAGAHDGYGKSELEEFAQRRLAALAVARAQWDKKRDAAWLVALATIARKDELKPAERKAAAAIKSDSPAFVAMQYHLAGLALAEGRAKEADTVVSSLLKAPLAISTRNRLLRLKMVSAPTAEASFAAAARKPFERELGVPVPDEGKPAAAPMFDDDLHAHLELHFPLATLVRLKPMLAAPEQRSAADLIWTRAVLLGQFAVADGVTDEVARDRATTRHLYQRFKAAPTPEAKRDAALLILANAPELVPRVSMLENADGERYWSCARRASSPDSMDHMSPAFLSPAERTQVDQEKAQLRALPKRSAYLIPLVIDWARKNKADPEAPKALHFLIASTRNECDAGAKEEKSRNHSKEAFEFLHRHYPKNEWTLKTRYYY